MEIGANVGGLAFHLAIDARVILGMVLAVWIGGGSCFMAWLHHRRRMQ